jgi:hypothetical protein
MPTTLPQLMGKILVIERVPSGKGQKQSQNAKVQGFVSLLAEDKLLLRYVVVHSAKRHRLGRYSRTITPFDSQGGICGPCMDCHDHCHCKKVSCIWN